MNLQSDTNNAGNDSFDIHTVGLVCVHGIGNAGAASGDLPRDVASSVKEGVANTGGIYRELPVKLVSRQTSAGRDPSVKLLIEYPELIPILIEFHDGSWHRDTVPPRFRHVMLWAFKVLPVLPHTLAAFWASDRLGEAGDESISMSMALSTLLVWFTGLMVVPLMFVLLVLGIFAPLPFRRLRPKLRHLVVHVLGDAYLYQSGALDRDDTDSVVQRLTQLTRTVKARTQFTALVGYSQGGEICRRVALAEDVDSSIFVGSGEAPLSMLRVLRSSPFLPVVLLLMFLPVPVLFARVVEAIVLSTSAFLIDISNDAVELMGGFLKPDLGGSSDPFSDLAELMPYFLKEFGTLLMFVAWMAITAVTLSAVSKRPADLERVPRVETMYVRSPVDPVSFGSLSEASLRRYVPIDSEPERFKALASEHVTYFSKWHTGAFILESLIGTQFLDMRDYALPPPLRWWVWVVAACAAGTLVIGFYGLGLAEAALIEHLLRKFTH